MSKLKEMVKNSPNKVRTGSKNAKYLRNGDTHTLILLNFFE